MAIRYWRGYKARYNQLTKRGLLEWEASEIAGSYPTFQRTDYTGKDPIVYIRRMVRSRYQMVLKLRQYDYSPEMIEDYITRLYRKKGWLFMDGTPNPWKMLDAYRNISIEQGEYFPTAKRRAHGRSISKGDIEGQRMRAKARARARKGLPTTLEEYDRGRGR